MNPRTLFVIFSTMLIPALACGAEDRRIGAINFYGYAGLDIPELRAALPFHEGDAFPSREQLAAAQAPFARAIGRRNVKFSPNCCLPDGRALPFVGIEDAGRRGHHLQSQTHG